MRGQGSSPRRVKNLFLSTLSRLALGPTHLPIQWFKQLAVKRFSLSNVILNIEVVNFLITIIVYGSYLNM
jgi:hypothetical protein